MNLPKTRSPGYPFIPLSKALARAREFYVAQRHHPAPMAGAVGLWGYKSKSSGGLQTVAALKSYGLLEDEGSGDQRQVKLTDLALRIIRDERDPSPDRDAAIREVALSPKIHSYLREKWGPTLPAITTVSYNLVHDRGYTESAARDVIRIYEGTIQFAKLDDSDIISIEDAEFDKEESEDDPDVFGLTQRLRTPRPKRKEQPGMKEDVFTLKEGDVALLWPESISAESYEDLKSWTTLVLRKIQRHVTLNEPVDGPMTTEYTDDKEGREAKERDSNR